MDGNYNSQNNLFTIIIGVNGTGKSRILQRITTNIKSRQSAHLVSNIPSNYANHLEIEIDKKEFIYYSRAGVKKSIIGDESKEIRNIDLDTKAIAVTTSPFDKFPVDYKGQSLYKHHDDDLYHYIGLRVSENSYNKSNFMHLLARSLIKTGIKNQRINVFNLLGYDSKVHITFKYKMPLWPLTRPTLTTESKIIELKDLLSNFHASVYNNIEKDRNKNNIYSKICNALIDNQDYIHRGVSVNKNSVFNDDLITLLDLGLIQTKEIHLFKIESQEYIPLSNTSSGQQCIILTILNISGVIKDNSVICIDEPEISLHPQWQKKFMSLLIQCFDEYKKCHFIISTHSPLIISELRSENCYILNMESGEATSSIHYKDKSVDFQLAKLFDEPGVNNEYLNRITVSLLSKLSKHGKLDSNDKKEAKLLINTSKKLQDHDTVKDLILILSEALEKVKKQ
ncbi:AAA family ATPase [Photobacterium arenosum]|uniref:AAA family ATPase n=1 Tax=Photobacterium arenosum TaxID=2774143 RepID=UPI0028891024|nr:AAA family ATPase [Photobacterium arenosum]